MLRTLGNRIVIVCVVLILSSTSALRADDVAGVDKLLCALMEATRCSPDGCVTDDPAVWNIPQFIEIDLVARRLQTTAASGENRATPITTLVREEGHIYIQGIEGGRAFSIVIDEGSGRLISATAASGGASSVFGACTPLAVAE